jgi:cell division cycle protein 20 (cofactor of APC complex)
LDAPDLMDDYYLNLLDWSKDNVIAIALGKSVYVWNATTGASSQLMQTDTTNDYVSSLCWAKVGNTSLLAIGTNSSEVQWWDVTAQKLVRISFSPSNYSHSLVCFFSSSKPKKNCRFES